MARKPKQESVTAIPKTGVKYVKGPDTEPTPVPANTQNTIIISAIHPKL